MDHSFHPRESDAQQPNGVLAILQFFNNTLHWLSGLIQMTEEEQEQAGIYLGEQPQENRD